MRKCKADVIAFPSTLSVPVIQIQVATTHGKITVSATPIGGHLSVHLCVGKEIGLWAISHNRSGCRVAINHRVEAEAVATALDMANLDWSFDSACEIPASTKAGCRRLFEALAKVIGFRRP